MKKLLLALVAAGFASATLGALAADEKPYTGQPKIEKPGRAADEVKSGGPSAKPGRAADETAAGTPAPDGKEGATGGKKKHKKKKKEPAQ